MKVRQIRLKSHRDAQFLESGIWSIAGQDTYVTESGVIPSPAGMTFNEGYVITDAPMTVVNQAARMYKITDRIIRKTAMRKNPVLTVFGNPGARRKRGASSPCGPVVYRLSRRAFALSYKHAADGKNYQHDFATGVTVDLLVDGSVRLSRADGKPLFKNF